MAALAELRTGLYKAQKTRLACKFFESCEERRVNEMDKLKGEHMDIGILGGGSVGFALGTKYAVAGHEVLVANSRGPESVRAIFAESSASITAASVSDVVNCDVVFLATPWMKVTEVLRPDVSWRRRILVDTTNIYVSYKPELVIADLKGDYGSEIVARLAPMLAS